MGLLAKSVQMRRRSWVALAMVLAGAAVIRAAELQPQTSRAYDAYRERVTQAFLARVRDPRPVSSARTGAVGARPGGEDGIIAVHGGLVHHWAASTFIRGARLGTVLDVARAYSAYADIYGPIVRSTLLGCAGDIYDVLLRLQEGGAGVTAVLDVRSKVRYFHPTGQIAYAISEADEIRQVVNAGGRDERLLPPGRDSGYLWRTSVLTRFAEFDGGVYVEMETLGLSRRFPPLLGWIIEPLARRIGRKSVEASLLELGAAVAGPRPALSGAACTAAAPVAGRLQRW